MGTLAGLLGIKQYREGRAEREVVRARRELEAATEAVHAARKALHDYQAQCARRERELYADLLSRMVRKADFDDVDAEIKAMREKIPEYEAAIETARQAEQAAETALERARAQLAIAMREREKFSDLVSMEKQEQVAEAARREELELEELRSVSAVEPRPEPQSQPARSDAEYEVAQP